ncbi:L-threonylcarbamoyladenylate synthase [Megasphaera paucivorans]|uniref:Threonylcarbamoyl-AMP synthase n=1 Tax=Megasphaera paucivorans TaxID=349095 RepID=A0A1G9T602_9FIRM|nr:L-threonylcarbamoyladenylate synthase [Megasphaera paucivorans]SDM43068.1 L-threonylcarbamoyladenylate synthase [Megasphaera paucivorans]
MKQTKMVHITNVDAAKNVFEEAGRIIRNGGLVVFPTETVYGIGANGLDAEACRGIYAAKGRPSDNPLILTVPDKEAVKKVAAFITPTAQKLLDTFWPGPLTIIFPRQPHIPDAATGGLDTVALRCPDHKIAHAFLQAAGVPVAGPSANLSGRPSPTTAEEVAHDMNGRVDMIIDGGPCHIGVESTIVECNVDDTVTILRPGAITLEMLRKIISNVLIDTNLVTGKGIPKAPGMKYRHYAPAAPMTVAVGTVKNVTLALRERYTKAGQEGKKVGFLVSRQVAEAFPKEMMYIWGEHGDKPALASQLYTGLLFFDNVKVDYILAEGVDAAGLGMAIMNRMKKAAGGDVIEV